MAATVTEVWRYPVKSMAGERLDAASVGEHGILGDRGWAARDERRGGIRGAKKIRRLMLLGARYDEEPTAERRSPHVTVTLPDGATVSTRDADLEARVSAAVEHPVTLHPLHPANDLEHYRRGEGDHEDVVAELRDIFGREPAEPLPDLSVFPPEIVEYESPPGTYFDAYPLHLVSTASLRTLTRLSPDSTVDVRRFRPNVVVDIAGDGFPEAEWVGRRVRLGAVEVDVVAPCPRCSMVQLPQSGLPADRALLRTVVREAGQNVGVYAVPVSGGWLRLGDEVSAVTQ